MLLPPAVGAQRQAWLGAEVEWLLLGFCCWLGICALVPETNLRPGVIGAFPGLEAWAPFGVRSRAAAQGPQPQAGA